MSRIGKKIIEVPAGVEVKIQDNMFSAKGPKGNLELKIPGCIVIKNNDGKLSIDVKEDCDNGVMRGTYRSLINNIIIGVSNGYEKRLEINGVGYRAKLNGKNLELKVGFSHPVEVKAPEGIEFKVEKNIIIISGIEKQLVGQIAAKIREVKKPEPYKGKGIKYIDEVIRKKVGKKAAASEGV